ncbi:MAG: hypothetical protein F6K31_29495 [Symploca sp. SIO2G7]|nr:hypothetical protein [Symploca sp. SIO2G7]
MLSQIVRPMVHTQLRLLANSQATRSTLISTVTQWLSFLGVKAEVTYLDACEQHNIRISLTVGKPEACDSHDWHKIVNNLNSSDRDTKALQLVQPQITPKQQSKLQRLLAYLIQVGEPEVAVNWDAIYPQLKALGLDEPMLLGIRSALKVPQSLEPLLEGLEPDLAAIALPKAVSIAMLDRQVNPHEDQALTSLLQVMKQA